MQKTTKNSLSRAGFELTSSGFYTAAPRIELSSQLGLAASLTQFKCTKYFRDDLPLVFEDAQCFNASLGTLRYGKRTTSTLKYYGTLWSTKCKSFPSKSSLTTQDYDVFICFLLCICAFMLTALMLNKFKYSHEHSFNFRNQDYD